MRDNISIITAAILSIMLVVILPLLSILERQDNITYNVALTLTSNFVDEVRAKGFIDKESYEKYLEQMSKTGAFYNYDFEAYKTIIIPAVNKVDGTVLPEQYVEDKLLYNEEDIKKELYSLNFNSEKTGIFTFDVGDEFYIRVKNSNIPSSSLIYRFISGEGNTNIVNISCGGIINSIDWEKYNATVKANKLPTIEIGLPKNILGSTNASVKGESKEYDWTGGIVSSGTTNLYYEYTFDFSKPEDEKIILDVELTNFDKFATTDVYGDELTVEILENYIQFNNFEGKFEIIEQDLNNTNGIIEDIRNSGGTADGKYQFQIVLSDFITEYFVEEVSITIKPGLGKNADGYESSAKDSEVFTLINDYGKHSVVIEGPFLQEDVDKGLEPKVKSKIYIDKDPGDDNDKINQYIYFMIKYTSIERDISEVIEAIRTNLKISYGDDLTQPSATNLNITEAKEGGFVSGYDADLYEDFFEIEQYKFNEKLYYGWIKVRFKYYGHIRNNGLLDDASYTARKNSLYLPEGWTTEAKDYGVLVNGTGQALSAVSTKYNVLTDDFAPRGLVDIKSMDKDGNYISVPRRVEGKTIYYISNRNSKTIKIDITQIKDAAFSLTDVQGSGIRKIGISTDGSNYEWTDFIDTHPNSSLSKTTREIDISAPEGTRMKIYVKYMDFSENESVANEYEVEILKPEVKLYIKGTKNVAGMEIVAGTNEWHRENVKVVASVNSSDGYILEMDGSTVYDPNTITRNLTRTGIYEYTATAVIDDSPFFDINTIPPTTATVIYKIDKTIPVITLPNIATSAAGWAGSADIQGKEVIVTDNHSGMREVHAYLSNSSTTDNSLFQNISSIVNTSDGGKTKKFKISELEGIFGVGSLIGEQYLHIRAIDNVGNEKIAVKNIKIDNAGPIIEFSTDSANVYITIKDAASGVESSTIGYGEVDTTLSKDSSSHPNTFTKNTTSEVCFTTLRDTTRTYTYVAVRDKVGNFSEAWLETIENPVVSIINAPGARIANANDVQATSLSFTDAFKYTFGNVGTITFKVENISVRSHVYWIATTSNIITQSNIDSYINSATELTAPEDETDNKTDMDRQYTLKFNANNADYSRYINIIVRKMSGQYIVHTINVTNKNQPRIISVYADPKVKYDKYNWGIGYTSGQDWNGYRESNSYLIDSTISVYNDSHNPVRNYQGTTKIRLQNVTFSNFYDEDITVQYFEEHNGECIDRWAITGICKEYETLYWKDLASTSTSTADFVTLAFDEEEFDAGQKIRVINSNNKKDRNGGDIIILN